jgi:hypothetical protein
MLYLFMDTCQSFNQGFNFENEIGINNNNKINII